MNESPYRTPRRAPDAVPRTNRRRRIANLGMGVSVACLATGAFLWWLAALFGVSSAVMVTLYYVLLGIAGVQAACGMAAAVASVLILVRARRQRVPTPPRTILGGAVASLLGVAGIFGVSLFWFLATFHFALDVGGGAWSLGLGGAWGRPLRVRGRIVHPDLVEGGAWTGDDTPAMQSLSRATRDVLAMFWFHDAKKEHGSVPAFARLAWVLVGLGAPADLVERSHVAALEEIDHTRRCFALAAAYAGLSLEPKAMPELLRQSLAFDGHDALVTLATESLVDGCLLEDYNADLAEAALQHAEDPAVLEVVRRIARDERSHGRLAWDMLAWALAVGGETVAHAVDRTARTLDPNAPLPYGEDLAPAIADADAAALLAHGRVPIEAWQPIYTARLASTRTRVKSMLAASRYAFTRRGLVASTKGAAASHEARSTG
jgi:uncharacterized membrane protein YuzA (DUF378 family)